MPEPEIPQLQRSTTLLLSNSAVLRKYLIPQLRSAFLRDVLSIRLEMERHILTLCKLTMETGITRDIAAPPQQWAKRSPKSKSQIS